MNIYYRKLQSKPTKIFKSIPKLFKNILKIQKYFLVRIINVIETKFVYLRFFMVKD